MNATKVGRRGQITLPRSTRQWLDLHEGDRVAFVRKGNEIVLQPMKQILLDLRGSVPVSEAQDFDVIRQQVIDRHTRDLARDEA